ncbi:hypothetical protein ACQPZF_24445 [Actinosynnema sp. CS-041913]|uniref:hypothetical protein n=1 Tax=Actinosynnema sp. CS-041913 TaxID=3239917 RepID=UPI003D94832B
MRRKRLVVAALVAFLAGVVQIVVAQPVSAGSSHGGLVVSDQAITAGPAVANAGNRLGVTGTKAPRATMNDVPDDQVVCNLDASLPDWSPRPTVNWTFIMQCDGRWLRGTLHMYLLYKFNESDSWSVAHKNENIPLNGGNSSTRVMQGLPHTLGTCFPAFWIGVAYVEVTFYAGKPLTDSIWVETVPEKFLSC